MRGLRSGLFVTAVAVFLPLCAIQAQAIQALASQAPAAWMLSTTALQSVIANPTVAQGLSSATVYQVSDSISDNTPVTSNAILSYHEYSGERAAIDVNNGRLSSNTRAIVLDQENWQGTCPSGGTCTPAYDLAHPVAAATQAAQAVQAHNQAHPSAPLTLIVTPGLDLFNSGALACPSGTTIAECYLNYNMAGRMAAIPGVAVIDLQAQSLEGDPGTSFNSAGSYWNFVYQAAAQAQAGAASAGKSIVILAGLSTRPNVSPTPSLCDIEQSAGNIQPLVSGFWMNVTDGNYPEAEEAMTHIMTGEGNCN
jgi:hypothetical protein